MELNKEERALRDALSQLETPEYDMKGAIMSTLGQKATSRRYRLSRAGLLAAALVAALAIGAAAVGFSGLWERFFPNPVPQNAVTTIGASQTSGEYTLTLEDAISDDNSVLLLLALRRTDGGDINPDARLRSNTISCNLLVDGEDFPGSTGFIHPDVLSEDGKTLYLCLQGQSDGSYQSLDGKTLTLKCGGIAVTLLSSDLYSKHELTVKAGAALPLSTEFPGYRYVGAEMTDRGLALTVTGGRETYGDLTCIGAAPSYLIDSRNAKEYSPIESEYLTLPDGTAAKRYFYGSCPLTVDDLPYLSICYNYTLDKVLSNQPMALSFSVGSGSAATAPLDKTVTLGEQTLHITELRYSALGLSLRMSTGMETANALYDNMPVAHLQDGTIVGTYLLMGSGNAAERADLSFSYVDKDGGRIFPDASQIVSISIGGTVIWTR